MVSRTALGDAFYFNRLCQAFQSTQGGQDMPDFEQHLQSRLGGSDEYAVGSQDVLEQSLCRGQRLALVSNLVSRS